MRKPAGSVPERESSDGAGGLKFELKLLQLSPITILAFSSPRPAGQSWFSAGWTPRGGFLIETRPDREAAFLN